MANPSPDYGTAGGPSIRAWQPPIENPLFTLAAYHRGMVQSWGVSRFNGHISSLGATIERAGAGLACAAASIAQSQAAFMPAPQVMGLDHIAVMRTLVAATAVATLVLLILVLL
jgi:hypothetical protein